MAALNDARTDTNIPTKSQFSQFLGGVIAYEPSTGNYDDYVNHLKNEHLQKPRDDWEQTTGQEYVPETEPAADKQRKSGDAPSK